MMHLAAAFQQALREADVNGIRRLWADIFPNLPQPQTDYEAAVMLHHARTQSEAIWFKDRAYSHRWLIERGLPSGLPDALKPRAERLYPVIADAVGIAVKPHRRGREDADALRMALLTKVEEMYAEGDKDPALVKSQIDAILRKWRGY